MEERAGRMNCTVNGVGYSVPMLWIGAYVTLASTACFMAMLYDLVCGICARKLWFSCKIFTLNAISLTLLAIATKVPTDISTPMPAPGDQFAKLSGTALICIAMGHFMPSIGAMEGSQAIVNVVPLVILVITAIVDVCLQMGTGLIFEFLPHHIITLALMLIMLLITCSAALSIPTMKQLLKQQHELRRPQFSRDGSEWSSDEAVMATFTRLKNDARKCWMMALSRDPVYVLRRSCLGAASDILCILQACVVAEAFFFHPVTPIDCPFSSDYWAAIGSIVRFQLFGIMAGALPPCLRTSPIDGFLSPGSEFNDDLIEESNGGGQVEKSWIQTLLEWKDRLIIGFKEFTKAKISWIKRFVLAFKIERYWLQNFVNLKEREIPSKIREWMEREIALEVRLDDMRLERSISYAIDLTLEIGRWLHILVVVFCKLLAHFALLLALVSKIKAFMKQATTKLLTKILFVIRKNSSIEESVDPPETKRELRNFVLHLEGEDGLVDWIFQSCYSKARVRRWGPSRDLISLLNVCAVSQGFNGLAPSGTDDVQSAGSNSQEPPNCWALPLVTLTSVAIAISPSQRARMKLVRGVRAGLKYVKLVDKKLDSEGMANIREAAEIVWRGVHLYRRWLDVDLTAFARKKKDLKKVLEDLAESGNRFVEEFEKSMANVQADKTSNVEWAPRALAGISMHRICGIILRDYSNFSTDELFEWLHILISDTLRACLTNLPRALYFRYVSRSFDAKEDYSVWGAAHLLGETEKILEALGKEGNQDLVINQCKYIDYWRSFMLNPLPRSSHFQWQGVP